MSSELSISSARKNSFKSNFHINHSTLVSGNLKSVLIGLSGLYHLSRTEDGGPLEGVMAQTLKTMALRCSLPETLSSIFTLVRDSSAQTSILTIMETLFYEPEDMEVYMSSGMLAATLRWLKESDGLGDVRVAYYCVSLVLRYASDSHLRSCSLVEMGIFDALLPSIITQTSGDRDRAEICRLALYVASQLLQPPRCFSLTVAYPLLTGAIAKLVDDEPKPDSSRSLVHFLLVELLLLAIKDDEFDVRKIESASTIKTLFLFSKSTSNSPTASRALDLIVCVVKKLVSSGANPALFLNESVMGCFKVALVDEEHLCLLPCAAEVWAYVAASREEELMNADFLGSTLRFLSHKFELDRWNKIRRLVAAFLPFFLQSAAALASSHPHETRVYMSQKGASRFLKAVDQCAEMSRVVQEQCSECEPLRDLIVHLSTDDGIRNGSH